MWEAAISVIGTVIVGLFGVWWKNRSNKSKEEELGEQKVINLHHQRNAEGKKAADARLREELEQLQTRRVVGHRDVEHVEEGDRVLRETIDSNGSGTTLAGPLMSRC